MRTSPPSSITREDVLTALLGCLESLVHYHRLLIEKHLHHAGNDWEKLRDKCLSMLQTLERIDPFRAMRYQEIGEKSLIEVFLLPNLSPFHE